MIQTYSLAEISAEKVVALADRARNEPRDLYDLWYLISSGEIDLARLVPAITAKLAFRSQPATGIHDLIARKEARLNSLWATRLGNHIAVLPPFEQVFRELMRALRQADLP